MLIRNATSYLRDRIDHDPNVEVLLGHEVRELAGEGHLEVKVGWRFGSQVISVEVTRTTRPARQVPPPGEPTVPAAGPGL